MSLPVKFQIDVPLATQCRNIILYWKRWIALLEAMVNLDYIKNMIQFLVSNISETENLRGNVEETVGNSLENLTVQEHKIPYHEYNIEFRDSIIWNSLYSDVQLSSTFCFSHLILDREPIFQNKDIWKRETPGKPIGNEPRKVQLVKIICDQREYYQCEVLIKCDGSTSF